MCSRMFMGRIIDAKHHQPARIQLIREDGQWQTEAVEIDEQGYFSRCALISCAQ